MVTMMSTKMTKAGQTTVPKEIRNALGIADDSRVYWFWDGERAYIAPTPSPSPLPLVDSREKFLARINEGKKSAAEGHVQSARALVAELRASYGLS